VSQAGPDRIFWSTGHEALPKISLRPTKMLATSLVLRAGEVRREQIWYGGERQAATLRRYLPL